MNLLKWNFSLESQLQEKPGISLRLYHYIGRSIERIDEFQKHIKPSKKSLLSAFMDKPAELTLKSKLRMKKHNELFVWGFLSFFSEKFLCFHPFCFQQRKLKMAPKKYPNITITGEIVNLLQSNNNHY